MEPHHGFPRSARLVTAAAYRWVFAEAVRSTDSLFMVLARGNSLGNARLGLAISRKHLRRAVDRNRAKRLARESFRRNRLRLPPLDLVVLSRPGLGGCSSPEIFASLERHWKRLGMRCANS